MRLMATPMTSKPANEGYPMTITNHIRRIQKRADDVIRYVDDRKYASAHCALDDIESKTRHAHEHVDHLQKVNEPRPGPESED